MTPSDEFKKILKSRHNIINAYINADNTHLNVSAKKMETLLGVKIDLARAGMIETSRQEPNVFVDCYSMAFAKVGPVSKGA